MQKTQWRSRTCSRKIWWLDNSRSQSSQWKVVNLETIIDMQSWCRTQWIQSYPCKTKTSQETQRSLQKFLEPNRKLKVIYTDNSLAFGKVCEDLSWNHCTSTPHRSETNGIGERPVRRVKEGTSAVLLRSGLDEKWWADSIECKNYLRNIQDLLSDGKTPYERRFGQPFKGPIIPCGSLVEYHPISAKGQSRIHQFGKNVLPGLFFGYALYAGGNLEGWHNGCRHWGVGNDGRIRNLFKKTQRKGSYISQRKWNIHFPVADGRIRRRSGTQNIHFDIGSPNWRRMSKRFYWRISRVSSTTSRLFSGSDAGEAMSNPQSNFSRREKNHSLFHWNTLTSPELHIRIWMLCKKAAPMYIGISMDQEICLVLGQVSLSFFSWMRNFQTDMCGLVGD